MSIRALYTGTSGLRNFSTGLDVIGNNIANVNTVAYKNSRITYQEVYSQTLKQATNVTNPQQVGLGIVVGSIDENHNQGALNATGRLSDMAIEGNGMFVLENSYDEYVYSRDGSFVLDSDHNLVSSNGLNVMGWAADTDGNINTGEQLSPINIPLGEVSFASATTSTKFSGNLDSNTLPVPVGAPPRTEDYSTATQIYDSLGNAHTLTMNFYKITEDSGSPGPPPVDPHTEWTYETLIDGNNAVAAGTDTITFDAQGQFDSGASTVGNINYTSTQLNNGSEDLIITPDLSVITQLNGEHTIASSLQDGYPIGTINGFSVNPYGIITVSATNGQFKDLAQMALADFNNTEGLIRISNNMYKQTLSSGTAQIGEALTAGRGGISASYLEGSNVDLAEEFTKLIITQRAFQANARVITTASDLMAETNNLVR